MFLKTSILWELCYNILLVDDFSVQPRLNKVNLCFVEGGFIWLTENMPPDPFTEFYAGPGCAHYVYG